VVGNTGVFFSDGSRKTGYKCFATKAFGSWRALGEVYSLETVLLDKMPQTLNEHGETNARIACLFTYFFFAKFSNTSLSERTRDILANSSQYAPSRARRRNERILSTYHMTHRHSK
jgi:hypothetical protein